MTQSSLVELRPLLSSDVDHFLTWAGDPAVTKSLFWDHYSDRESAAAFLKSVAESHPWFMAICVNGRPVGAITLDRRTGSGICRAELGYVLAKSLWGQGIATAAAQIAVSRGFNELNVERIEALVDPENLASIRVLENVGLIREGLLKRYLIHRGQLKDRYIYAKTK